MRAAVVKDFTQPLEITQVPRPEPGPDVRARRNAVQEDTADQAGNPRPHPMRRMHVPEDDVHRQPDEHDVAEGADPGPLPQRDPQQEHDAADDDRPGADRETERPGQPLVEDVPGIEPEPREDEQRGADAVEDETAVQLSETQAHASNVHSRDAHGDGARRPARRGRRDATPSLRPHRHPVG